MTGMHVALDVDKTVAPIARPELVNRSCDGMIGLLSARQDSTDGVYVPLTAPNPKTFPSNLSSLGILDCESGFVNRTCRSMRRVPGLCVSCDMYHIAHCVTRVHIDLARDPHSTINATRQYK